MALFTVVLEFDGGTYISQFRATSAHNAAVKHAAHLIGNEEMSTPLSRRRLADRLTARCNWGGRNVWCCSASISKKFALVNIVATA
jgi:hypothetical protein